jgi:hypothetical protein
MSDFNDLMLDGVICQCCGQFIGDVTGYPRSCGGCERLEVPDHPEPNAANLDSYERATTTDELDDDLPF